MGRLWGLGVSCSSYLGRCASAAGGRNASSGVSGSFASAAGVRTYAGRGVGAFELESSIVGFTVGVCGGL